MLLVVIAAFLVQVLAFNMGRLLPDVPGIKGVPGKVLDWVIVAIGILFALPPVLLTSGDFLPVAAWSAGWIGAYFIGNIPNKTVNKFVFAAWYIATVVLMVWFKVE